MDRSENMISVVVNNIFPLLDGRCRRLLAGSLAIGYGYGGQKLVCHYPDLSQQTLCKAVAELKIEGDHLAWVNPAGLGQAGKILLKSIPG